MSKRGGKIRVLFVYVSASPSPFVRRDLNTLKRRFNVKPMKATTFLVPRRGRNPLVFWHLLKGVWWADVVYSWFANLNAFFIVLFCRILRKKSVIVTGGYDVAYLPEIDYGVLSNPIIARRVKFVLENADKALPFSNFAKKNVLDVTSKANIEMIPLACDTKRFKPRGKKENIVLTVCYVAKRNLARKGLETFLESARFLRETRFILIGAHKDDSIDYLRKISPSNVEFTGYVSEKELIRWYQRAKVYCQLSYQEGEGAGGALGEAMACECVPVVSSKAVALRETVGNCGFYVPYGDAKATAEAIKSALHSPPELGQRARERMKDLFPIRKREENLLNLINSAIKAN